MTAVSTALWFTAPTPSLFLRSPSTLYLPMGSQILPSPNPHCPYFCYHSCSARVLPPPACHTECWPYSLSAFKKKKNLPWEVAKRFPRSSPRYNAGAGTEYKTGVNPLHTGVIASFCSPCVHPLTSEPRCYKQASRLMWWLYSASHPQEPG